MPLLLILAASCLISSLTMRIIDPVVPAVARDLAVSVDTVALLASAFTFPYALCQPLLGSLGDALGKALIIKICLAVVLVCLAAGAFAPNIQTLFVVRVIGGAAGGGIIPLSFAIVGDRFPFEQRQIALSRVLTAILVGQLMGSLGSGVLAAYAGWRASMLAGAAFAAAALTLTVTQLRPASRHLAEKFTLKGMCAGFRQVFANPRSRVCFTAVFVEGILIFGLLPYIAALLEARGAGGLKEAGFVLAGFGLGGFLYTSFVGAMLPRLGFMRLIRWGACVCGAGFVGLASAGTWPLEALAFVVIGIGFYMIHNSLQTQATELAPEARGAAVAAHAFFFFLGQAAGPMVYGFSLPALGSAATLLAAGGIMAALGFATARGLEFLGARQALTAANR